MHVGIAPNFRNFAAYCSILLKFTTEFDDHITADTLQVFKSSYDLYCVGGTLSLTQSINKCSRSKIKVIW